MRPALRMLAAVKPVATSSSSAAAAAAAPRYIQPGLPTGLTGLRASTSPRSSLLYLYSTTLEKLKSVPESSLYRQSVENLTRSRLAVVQSVVPEGLSEWTQKMNELLEKNKDGMRVGKEDKVFTVDGARAGSFKKDGKIFVARRTQVDHLPEDVEWDGEPDEGGELEGSRTEAEREEQKLLFEREDNSVGDLKGWEPEPQLTADQIAQIEDKIGHGLIEELIQVAEGELKLTDIMIQSKAWEDLEEKPVEGQWTYFGRKA